MRENNIPDNIQLRVKDNLKYILNNENKINPGELNAILNKLSPSLREILLMNSNGHILKEIPLFSKNFSEELLRELCFQLKEQNYSPDDYIFCVKKYFYLIFHLEIISKMICLMILCITLNKEK